MSRTAQLGALVLTPMVLLGGCVTSVVLLGAQASVASDCVPRGLDGAVDPGSVPAGPVAGYSGVQLANAAHVMNAATALGLDARAQHLGVMTAMGESGLVVLDRGDTVGPDSRGLFQQRDNGAWGSYADRMDPVTSATSFFRALLAVPRWETLQPTIAAHRVQGNANPFHYATYYQDAVQVVQALSGPVGSGGAVGSVGGPPPAGGRYDLGPVRPHLQVMVEEVGAAFDVAEVGGYRESARDPEGHPAGLAADFMVDDDTAKGDALADYVIAKAARLSVDYVLWRQRAWSLARADEGWRPMADRGSPTLNHQDHPHVNVTPTPSAGAGAGSPAGLPCLPGRPVGAGPWTKPVVGPISSSYGMRTNPVTGVYRLHRGTDFGAPCDAPIYAASAGTVVAAGPAGGYGNLITVDHGGGAVTRYAHMWNAGVLTGVGAVVTAGQPIGRVGSNGNSTGCHLHFEVRTGDEFTDPEPFMAERGAPLG